MKLAVKINTKGEKSQTRVHGPLTERFGRYVYLNNDKNSFAKLDNRKIRKIRKLSNAGSSSRKIAEQFEVSKTTILQIVQRKSWRHV